MGGGGRVGGRVGGGGGVGLGGQVGCERRIEVFVKIQKNNLAGGELVRSGWGGGGGGGGGRSGRRGGARLDVNKELKFL